MLDAMEREMAASCVGGSETWLMTCGRCVFWRRDGRKDLLKEVEVSEVVGVVGSGVVVIVDDVFEVRVPILRRNSRPFNSPSFSSQSRASTRSPHLVQGLPRRRALHGPDERRHRERAAEVAHGCGDRRRRSVNV